MQSRGSLVLAIIAVAVGSFIFLWEKDQPGTDERLERGKRVFPALEQQAVKRIDLHLPGGESVELERGEKGWSITAPLVDRADDLAVDRLLDDLAEAETIRRVPASEVAGGDASTGLGEGALRVELRGEGLEESLEIGSHDAPGGARYARRADASSLFLVGKDLADSLDKPAAEWRDRRLIDVSNVEVKEFSVTHGGRTLRFERRGGERWWITEPVEDLAQTSDVNALLSDLVTLRADSVTEDLPAIGEPELVATLKTGERKIELTVGEEDSPSSGRRLAIASDRSAGFVVPWAGLARDLDKDDEAWRSKRALDFSPWDVMEFELSRGGRTVRVSRVEGESEPSEQWTALEPADFALDGSRVADLLSELSLVDTLRLETAPDESMEGEARLVLRFREPEENPEREFVVGEPVGEDAVLAWEVGRPAGLVVARATADSIDPARIERQAADSDAEVAGSPPGEES